MTHPHVAIISTLLKKDCGQPTDQTLFDFLDSDRLEQKPKCSAGSRNCGLLVRPQRLVARFLDGLERWFRKHFMGASLDGRPADSAICIDRVTDGRLTLDPITSCYFGILRYRSNRRHPIR
jgi:hypothetical protein